MITLDLISRQKKVYYSKRNYLYTKIICFTYNIQAKLMHPPHSIPRWFLMSHALFKGGGIWSKKRGDINISVL